MIDLSSPGGLSLMEHKLTKWVIKKLGGYTVYDLDITYLSGYKRGVDDTIRALRGEIRCALDHRIKSSNPVLLKQTGFIENLCQAFNIKLQ